MKRIAFFVEGLTEQLFLEKLISEIFTKNKIAIETGKIQGGGKRAKISFTTISAASITAETEYFVLIYDCGGDTKISSYILKQRESLIRNGYSKILGIRDVFPLEHKDIPKLRQGLYFKMPQTPIKVDFILSIMEIESWFLSESTHFNRVDANLTLELIKKNLNFDPSIDDMQARIAPASDLHNCYKLVRKKYSKEEVIVKRTVNALDYAHLYLALPSKVSSLKELVTELDNFIAN